MGEGEIFLTQCGGPFGDEIQDYTNIKSSAWLLSLL